MNKNKKAILLTFFLAMSATSFAVPATPMVPSEYSYTQKGDELIDGQTASITWRISITNDYYAVVHISSWHAPFTCDGKFNIKKSGEVFNLTWSETENKDQECDTAAPQIAMKQAADGTWLAKSELFPWGDGGWEKIKKIH